MSNDKPISRMFRPGAPSQFPEHEVLIDADTAVDPNTIPTLLEAALKLQEAEKGFGAVRDIESDIFQRPFHTSPQADFDGDTPHGDMPFVDRVSKRRRLLRQFNNMSLTEKNKIRRIRKKLSKASVVSARIASTLRRNMKKLHDQ